MTWRHISECLDSGLIGALKIESSSASVGTGKADAAQLMDFTKAGAPAETNEGTGARGPRQVAALGGGQGVRRVRLVVINGCTASKAARRGAAPRRAVHLFIATVNGVRVHQPAAST